MKRWVKMSFILILISLLTACGITAENRVNVNEHFAGTRHIKLIISSNIAGSFTGENDLFRLFSDNVKEPLILEEIDVVNNDMIVNISFSFKSIEDYNKIVSKLNGDSGIVNYARFVNHNLSTSSNSGIEFSDSSSTYNILRSVFDKAIEEGIFKVNDPEKIISKEEYSLEVDGRVLILPTKDEKIEYNSIEYIGPVEINILTEIIDDNRVNRAFFVKLNKNIDKKWLENISGRYNLESKGLVDAENFVYKFVVENASLEQIKHVTRQVLNLNEYDLRISSGYLEKMLLEFRIFEKIDTPKYQTLKVGKSVWTSSEIKEEYNFEEIKDTDISFSFNEMLNGFERRLVNEAIFESIYFDTKIDLDGLISRKIQINFEDGKFKRYFAEMLGDLFDRNGILFEVDENKIVVELSDDIAKFNEAIFDSSFRYEIDQSNPLKEVFTLDETIFLDSIKFKKIHNQLILPDEISVKENISEVEGNRIENFVVLERINYKLQIAIGLGILLVGIFIFGIFVRNRKKL